jgi:predicted secreted protein
MEEILFRTIMSIVLYSLSYFLIWWVVFFIALPFGITPQKKIEQGHASSAPEKPKLFIKIIITSLISLLLTFALYYIIEISSIKIIAE